MKEETIYRCEYCTEIFKTEEEATAHERKCPEKRFEEQKKEFHFKRVNTCMYCKHASAVSRCKKVSSFGYKIHMFTTCDLFEEKEILGG